MRLSRGLGFGLVLIPAYLCLNPGCIQGSMLSLTGVHLRDFSELLGWEGGMGSPLRARQWRFLGSFREPKQDFGHGYTSLISVSLERVFSY